MSNGHKKHEEDNYLNFHVDSKLSCSATTLREHQVSEDYITFVFTLWVYHCKKHILEMHISKHRGSMLGVHIDPHHLHHSGIDLTQKDKSALTLKMDKSNQAWTLKPIQYNSMTNQEHDHRSQNCLWTLPTTESSCGSLAYPIFSLPRIGTT